MSDSSDEDVLGCHDAPVWLLLLAPALCVLVYRQRRRRLYELAARVSDGGCEKPGVGVLHMFMGNTEDILSSLKKLSYAAMENDGLIRSWLGPMLYFVSVDPVDLEVVLKNCLEKDDLYRFARTVIGNGTIFATVPIWKPRRKIVLPAFSPKFMDGFVSVFARQAQNLANKLGERAGGGKFPAWPYINAYTLDSVCETALGVKLNAQDDPKTPFFEELNNILEVISDRIFQVWLHPDYLFKLFPSYRRHQNSLKVIHGFVDDIITKKKEGLKATESFEANSEFDSSNSSKTFLDLLIGSSGGEQGYSNLELREEVLMLAMAGVDTTATAVGYALKLMAKYPDVQAKVHEELDEVFGKSDRLLEKEDVSRLTYLDRVIKESLRLFPPTSFIARKVEEETVLPSGRVLPAGSGVTVSIWGTHRNPKYWGADAEQFDPDRFLPERLNLKHPGAFMPFSNGRRNCIGYQYAMTSIKAALSSILRHHRVVADPETHASPQIRHKLEIMIKAVDGYEIALEKRL